MKNKSLIQCNFCGESFCSVADFENHIDANCSKSTQPNNYLTGSLGTQIIYPNGKSVFKKLGLEPIRRFLTREKSDEDLTEPTLVTLICVMQKLFLL